MAFERERELPSVGRGKTTTAPMGSRLDRHARPRGLGELPLGIMDFGIDQQANRTDYPAAEPALAAKGPPMAATTGRSPVLAANAT
jgi:hypothetical protein